MSDAHVRLGRKKTDLSIKERDLIIKLKSEGNKSERQIAAIVGCTQSTVNKTVKRFTETKCNESRPRSGRPSIISSSDKRYIHQISTRSRRKTVPQIADEFNVARKVKVSRNYVRNVLHSYGLRGHVAANKPFLRPANVVKRRIFCRKILAMSKKQILKIFNTDETKVELFGDKKNGYCWRNPGERFHPDCVKPTVKHGGGSIMVWGGISAKGQSKLRLIEGIKFCGHVFFCFHLLFVLKSSRKFYAFANTSN